MLSLSNDILILIFGYGSLADVCHLSSVNKHFSNLCSSPALWRHLIWRDQFNYSSFLVPEELLKKEEEDKSNEIVSLKVSGSIQKTKKLTQSTLLKRNDENSDNNNNKKITFDWKSLFRKNYDACTFSRIKWENTSLNTKHKPKQPAPREGHDMVLLGDYIFMWGGFVNDPKVYVLDTKDKEWKWYTVPTIGKPPRLLYGHTMTAVPDYSLIVLFGGLTQGGYYGETNSVYLLHIRDISEKPLDSSPKTPLTVPVPSAPAPRNQEDEEEDEEEQEQEQEEVAAVPERTFPFVLEWEQPTPPTGIPSEKRGYHSACLVGNSKLFFFGGISRQSCIAAPVLLDLARWTWLPVSQKVLTDNEEEEGELMGKMGHSSFFVDDRVWLCGGGLGKDLCRHGRDWSDIWVADCRDINNVTWKKLDLSFEAGGDYTSLGRCHASVQVGKKIVFFFGSINYSNSVCVFDMETKKVSCPVLVGRRPIKRMSSKAVFKDGKMWVWGGFSYQRQNMGDLWFLRSLSAEEYEKAAKSQQDEQEDEEEDISPNRPPGRPQYGSLCPVQ